MSAAASTVEALIFGLRERGPAALAEPRVQSRISDLDETQLHAIAERLEKLRPEIAGAWTSSEIESLATAWVDLQQYHERTSWAEHKTRASHAC
jgi:hypothetical protein